MTVILTETTATILTPTDRTQFLMENITTNMEVTVILTETTATILTPSDGTQILTETRSNLYGDRGGDEDGISSGNTSMY